MAKSHLATFTHKGRRASDGRQWYTSHGLLGSPCNPIAIDSDNSDRLESARVTLGLNYILFKVTKSRLDVHFWQAVCIAIILVANTPALIHTPCSQMLCTTTGTPIVFSVENWRWIKFKICCGRINWIITWITSKPDEQFACDQSNSSHGLQKG